MITLVAKDKYFISDDHRYRVMREHGKTPNGNELHGRWVFRDLLDNTMIDFDQYQNDLFERNDIEVLRG